MRGFQNKSLGVVGGAGPMAGILLCEYIIRECQQNYGCKNDEDFPQLTLISVPFIQMLEGQSSHLNENKISEQLEGAINTLATSNDNIVIACNTLHGFLRTDTPLLIDMIAMVKIYLQEYGAQYPLILCTNTSREKGLYDLNASIYPEKDEQTQVDYIINAILGGDTTCATKESLDSIIISCVEKNQNIDSVILGCSELSVLMKDNLVNKKIRVPYIDPLQIVSKALCEILSKKKPCKS